MQDSNSISSKNNLKQQSSRRVKYLQIRIMEDVARRLSDPGVHYTNKHSTVLEIKKFLDEMKTASPHYYYCADPVKIRRRIPIARDHDKLTKIADLNDGSSDRFDGILAHLRTSRVVAVLRGGHPDRLFMRGVELAEMNRGVALEVALDSFGSMEVLEELALALPSSCLLGAATVMTEYTARRAAKVGARFITSPICPPNFISWCEEEGCLAIPAGFTPSELHHLLQSGAKAVKLFPACSFSPAGLKQVIAKN